MQVNIDPVILRIGDFPILRWYSMAYVAGFFCAFWLFKKYNEKYLGLTQKQSETLLFRCFIAVMLGGRLGYVVFYNLTYYLSHPFSILAMWQGGMSFHGGLLGVVFAILLFCRKENIPPFKLGDIAVICATPGLFFGRIANFINGELWGRVTDSKIGFVFPYSGTIETRYPTQLFEAFFEGLVLFLILFFLSKKTKLMDKSGVIFGLFLALYGIFRFGIEFFREPDAHIGYLAFETITMGHVLCFVMALIGCAITFMRIKNANR
jgi:phosphatidylglycerol:prolipoprotein diacylglycerol transferase